MGLKKLLTKPLSGYPGDYKKMRRGTQGFDQTPQFRRPDDSDDRRSRIPPHRLPRVLVSGPARQGCQAGQAGSAADAGRRRGLL